MLVCSCVRVFAGLVLVCAIVSAFSYSVVRVAVEVRPLFECPRVCVLR